jgi:hypothetical protein
LITGKELIIREDPSQFPLLILDEEILRDPKTEKGVDSPTTVPKRKKQCRETCRWRL